MRQIRMRWSARASAIAAATAMMCPEFQEDYEESNVLTAAVRSSQGLSPYPDPHNEPIVFNPYGPVVYYGLGPLISHYGVHFRAARIAVWCAALACALLIAAIVALI